MFLKLCLLRICLFVCLFVNFGVIVVCFVLFPFFYWILESRESFGHVYSMFHYINVAMFHYIKNVLFLSTQDCRYAMFLSRKLREHQGHPLISLKRCDHQWKSDKEQHFHP